MSALRSQRQNEVLPVSLAPRGLTREQAAAYIGFGPTKFDELVKRGLMPKPKRVDGSPRWDRWKVDEAFGLLPNEEEANPFDELLGNS